MTVDETVMLRFDRTERDQDTEICVALAPGAAPVRDRLLSNFFEHMSYATIGGCLAELLISPQMPRRHHLLEWQVSELRRNARLVERAYLTGDSSAMDGWVSSPLASGFGTTIFDDQTDRGIPLGWAAVGTPGDVVAAVGRIGGAVRLRGRAHAFGQVLAVDGGAAGVRQAVFPPVRRTRGMTAEAYFRTTGPGELQFGLRRRYGRGGSEVDDAGLVLASDVAATEGGPSWQRVQVGLQLNEGAVAEGEPVDFFLRWRSDVGGDAVIDRVSLLPDDHVDSFDPDVVRIMQRARIPELRWPGGNFASFYHWRDGIGPRHLRPAYENRAWGGLEHHLIGTDEYLRLCEIVGAEPHITVNSGTGTAEEAAAWVEYCNGDAATYYGALRAANGHPQPYNVRIWEVGNENYGEWQGGNVGAEQNAARFAAFARVMRKASPLPLTLLACGSWFDLVESGGAEYGIVANEGTWHEELLVQAPNDVDVISLHSLPVNDMFVEGRSDLEVNRALLAHVATAERRWLPELLARADRSERKKELAPVSIAVTEWGPLGLHPGRLMIENFGGVVWSTTFLNAMVRLGSRVAMTSPNGFMHGGAIKKGAGVTYTDPQFEVIQEYWPFVGGTPVPVALRGPGFDVNFSIDLGAPESDIPIVDALAVWGPDGLHVALANRDELAEHRLTLSIDNRSLAGPVQYRGFDRAGVDLRSDPLRPVRTPIRSAEVQPQEGVLVLELPPLGAAWLSIPTTSVSDFHAPSGA